MSGRAELSYEEAVALAESNWWESKTDEEIVRFQLFTERLCVPFDRFHRAIEKVLGRSVWTHEFAQIDLLRKEFLGERVAPTFEEILNLIPEEKRIVCLIKPKS